MRQQYREINFRPHSLKLIQFIDALIRSYQQQGFTLSVRQLYYQLVARDIVENTERSYKNIASLINDARLAGMLDWDAIEDRGRDIEVRSRWGSGASIVRACADSFHMDMWSGQTERVFVIVEKAALAGVLGGVCREYDVPLLAARGYPSVSVVRELALQHLVPALEEDQVPVVLHLGDHDPSGIDMTRDLRERLDMFIEGESVGTYAEHSLSRIALTRAQIDEKKPPPNPAKTTDARFADYRRIHGDESWELDALEPSYLVNLVRKHVLKSIDMDVWKQREDEIADVKLRLSKVADEFENQ